MEAPGHCSSGTAALRAPPHTPLSEEERVLGTQNTGKPHFSLTSDSLALWAVHQSLMSLTHMSLS